MTEKRKVNPVVPAPKRTLFANLARFKQIGKDFDAVRKIEAQRFYSHVEALQVKANA